MPDLILSHSNDNNDFTFFIFGIQSFYELNEFMLIDFWADLDSHWVWDTSEEFNLNLAKNKYMRTIELTSPFTNPKHVCGLTVVLSMNFPG